MPPLTLHGRALEAQIAAIRAKMTQDNIRSNGCVCYYLLCAGCNTLCAMRIVPVDSALFLLSHEAQGLQEPLPEILQGEDEGVEREGGENEGKGSREGRW